MIYGTKCGTKQIYYPIVDVEMLHESFPGEGTERDEAIGEVGDVFYGEDEVDPLLLSQGHTPSDPKPGPSSGTFGWHELTARIYSRIVAR